MTERFWPAAALLLTLSACGDRAADPAPGNAADSAGERQSNATAPLPSPKPEILEKMEAASRFTSVKAQDCRTLEYTAEEAGFWRRACPGEGGYKVETTEGDLRQNMIVIAPDGKRTSLDLIRLIGSGFSEIGETLEWRGGAATPFRPRTLTLRYKVFEDPGQPSRATSYLAVAKLDGTPCIVAKIRPGAAQSAEARRVADAQALPDCLA